MAESKLEELNLEKRSRFLQLLDWERHRSESCSKHKTLLNTIISRIFQRVSISRETNMAILKFLKERAVNSLQFSETLKSEKSYLPDPAYSKHTSVLSLGLSAISEYQSQLSHLFSAFNDSIE